MKLSRYITLNILSVVGYIYVLLALYLSFVVKPEVMNNKYVEDIDMANMTNSFFYSEILIKFVKLSFLILIIFILLFLIELILKRFKVWNIKFECKNKVYNCLFFIGLVLNLYPMVFFIYPIVLRIFNLH